MKNKKNKKKIISIVALAASFVLCIGATFGVTLAYFGGSDTESLGTITLKTGITMDTSSIVSTSNTLVVPGQPVAISAEATVAATTLGTPDAASAVKGYLRAKFTIGEELGALNATIDGGNGSDLWVKGADNYYYLVSAVNGTAANSVLRQVSVGETIEIAANIIVPESLDNDDSGKQMTSAINFQLVQAELYDGNNPITSATVADAQDTDHVVYEAFTAISTFTGEVPAA